MGTAEKRSPDKNMIDTLISQLIDYSIEKNLISEEDEPYTVNQLLDLLRLGSFTRVHGTDTPPISEILSGMCDYACSAGIIPNDTVTERDLFDTRIMGIVTPRPSAVIEEFERCLRVAPRVATDWFYDFCGDVNYIRTDRIARDLRWTTATEYGSMDITVNLSKPGKDPRDIAAAASEAAADYPRCMLCIENEGFCGNHHRPARQNLRIIPLELGGEQWGLQYSPYSYYPEHCIVLSKEHRPMKIDSSTFTKMLDFVDMFPHYFVGSNADLPIVGGSILSHEHYQGGRYVFPMDRAQSVYDFIVPRYSGVSCSVLKWPLSVIRLESTDRSRLSALAERILKKWRQYSDPICGISASDGDGIHNTITPIAHLDFRMYRLDLVLRNNQVSPDRPLGIHHPRPEYHHIKKENIGLIEVMGLAVLPSRLSREMDALRKCILDGEDPSDNPLTAPHADWARDFCGRYCEINEKNIDSVIRREIGSVFKNVLCDCAVFPDLESFRRFIDFVCAPYK